MSHDATNWAIKQRGLKPVVKLLLWHLADRHNPDHGCFPEQATLAHDCEISRASVNRHLAELEEMGLIRREARRCPHTNRQLPTRYRLACEPDFDTQDVVGRVSDCDTESRVSKPAVSVSHSSETLTSKRTSKKPLTPDQPDAGAEPDVEGRAHVSSDWTPELYAVCCRLSGHAPAVQDKRFGWVFEVSIVAAAEAEIAGGQG